MIRVLHILDKISYSSGVSNVVLNYYLQMDHKEIVFDFLVNEPIVESELRKKIIDTGSKIYVTVPLDVRNLYQYKKSLEIFFSKHLEYKIVHGHMPNLAFIYLKVAKKYKVPIRIIHSHTTGASITFKNIRNIIFKEIGIKYATNFMACSKGAKVYLLRKKKKECILLKNAINIKIYSYNIQRRNRVRKQLGIQDKFVLGHIGRFSIEKNHKFLINILESLISKKNNVILLLIGDGNLRKEIEQQISKKKLQEYVLFLGQQKDVSVYLDAMDLFLFPSLFEGSPVSLIEAQANGLECLVSEQVTREVKVCDLVEYLSISSYKIWVKRILEWNINTRNNPKYPKDELRRNGYDISLESIKLEKFYKEIMRNYINEK